MLGVVVKADGYGHGIATVARVLVAEGVHWLIVNAVAEARQLRDADITTPIYICGPVFPFEAEEVAQTGARVVLYEPDVARALDAAARERATVVPVHIKVETGTHRQGLELPDALAFGLLLRGLPGLTLEGLTTHYADIEDTTERLRRDGHRLIIEPVTPHSLNALLATLEPIDEDFAPIDELPIEPVDL